MDCATVLKAKSGNDVAIAIGKIIQDTGRCPKNYRPTEEKNFTMQICRNSLRNIISIII